MNNIAQNKPLEGEVLESNRPGRKPKYCREYCNMLVDLARHGLGISHFCVKNNLSLRTIQRWRKEHPEFADAEDQSQAVLDAYGKDFLEKAIRKEIVNSNGEPVSDIDARLVLKMYDRYSFPEHRTTKPSTTPNILVNVNNAPVKDVKELTTEERQEKMKELIDKEMESRRLTKQD